MSIYDTILLSLAFLLISTLYSSAGFGGGSSYLAILAFFGVDFMLMKSIALICNIVVVSGNLLVFRKKKMLNIKNSLPLIALSIPLAFIGGLYPLKASSFFILLGISLSIAGCLLIAGINNPQKGFKRDRQLIAIPVSGGLGLLSGLTGIGGGIFLSPVLHLLRWDNPQKIAATASLFIMVNSIAGLGGHMIRQSTPGPLNLILPLLLAVVIGGQIGSRTTAYRLQPKHIKLITALLVIGAGIKILLDHLPKAL